MNCPECGEPAGVRDSRAPAGGSWLLGTVYGATFRRRRRKCRNGHRFTTFEIPYETLDRAATESTVGRKALELLSLALAASGSEQTP